jgi:protease I
MPDSKGTILILVGPEYEDLEVWYPKLRLEEAGFTTKLAGIGEANYRGKHGYPAAMDGQVREFPAGELAGIIAPGGWAPDKLRRDLDVLTRVREVHAAGKLVGTICHGPWILISAGIVRGRTLTSTVGIRDDVINAGATWVDRPAVVDGNIVSARVPKDLPAFCVAMLEVLDAQVVRVGDRVAGSGRREAGDLVAASRSSQ